MMAIKGSALYMLRLVHCFCGYEVSDDDGGKSREGSDGYERTTRTSKCLLSLWERPTSR